MDSGMQALMENCNGSWIASIDRKWNMGVSTKHEVKPNPCKWVHIHNLGY